LPSETTTRKKDAAEQDSGRKEEQSPTDEQRQPGRDDVLRAVLKGAALGSAAGAAVGAWAAFARVMWPDQLDAAKDAAVGTARDVGRTAASAAAGAVDPDAVMELLPSRGADGNRSEVVKRTARDAATAAAKAAREAITTRNGSDNGNGHGNGASRKRKTKGD
jgi:hypothetical protein